MLDLIETAGDLLLRRWRFYFCNDDSHTRNRKILYREFKVLFIHTNQLNTSNDLVYKIFSLSWQRVQTAHFSCLWICSMLIAVTITLRSKVCFITLVCFIFVHINSKQFFEITVVFQKNKVIYVYVYNIHTYSTVSVADREHCYN